MTQVLLVPGNPLDLPPEHLQPLAEQITSANDNVTVDIGGMPQRGYGVTWWEVLIIYLGMKGADAVVGHVYELLLDEITERTKDWHRERRLKMAKTTGKADDETYRNKKLAETRPFYFEIRDEEGYVLRAIKIDPAGDIEDDQTNQARERPLRPRPKPSDSYEMMHAARRRL